MASAVGQTRSVGVFNRGFLRLSRPTVFWEFRLNRSLYVLAFLAMVIPLAYALGVTVPIAHVLMARFPSFHLRYLSQGGAVLGLAGWPGNSDFAVVAGGALGFGVMAVERINQRVVNLLEGPVRRREILRTKMTLVVLMILLANGVSALMVAATSLRLGGLQLGAGLLHVLLAAAMAEGLAMTAMAAGTVIRNPVTAGSAVLVAIFLFPLLGAVGYHLVPPTNPIPGWLGYLSIFPTEGFAAGPASVVLAAADCAWAVVMGGLTFALWDRVRVENVLQPFAFPVLWDVYFGGLAALSAVALMMLVNTGNVIIRAGSGVVLFFPLGVAFWFGWRWFIAYLLHHREVY
jgi:hypothetical protein